MEPLLYTALSIYLIIVAVSWVGLGTLGCCLFRAVTGRWPWQ